MSEDARLLEYGLLLLAAGLGSGFAGGLFGIGGGVLRVPILVHLFQAFGFDESLTMHMAAGTSLTLAIPTGVRAAAAQQRAGHLDPAFLRSWLPPLLVGVLLGLVAVRTASGAFLTGVFGVTMLAMGVQMGALPAGLRLAERVPGHPIRDLLAATIGAVSTAIGISGGAFVAPILTMLGQPIHRAVAISAASAAAIAALAAAGFVLNGLGVPARPAWSLGYVDLLAVAIMLPAILVSVPLGVRLGSRLSESWLHRGFGVFLLVIAADMLSHAR